MAKQNSRSLQGRAIIAVHLRTFGSRYHRTHNPPSGDESFLNKKIPQKRVLLLSPERAER
ncbi:MULTISPECIES: hypothetical protein [Xenorhabdus]|uniref:hypothetical protein n=1 Tax=Xenorhabdus TaxID=626 RepID=UPI00064B0B24|nr:MULTISPECIES: hypothetical protein [Xenorhabdus]KLU16122.1 hypothetical protein AAY47_07235 [Xenorhabdus griffiniae]KOP31798.1 hypothetical protein AFK69_18945 [Xenorhabdus sp. GDc328]